jgi:hypothetical protein
MDYNAFSFNYLHSYSDDEKGYIELAERFGEQILQVNAKDKGESFRFHLGSAMKATLSPDVFGYSRANGGDANYDIPSIGGKAAFTQNVKRLERYYYELNVADFYNYRDELAEQYVVLKGAADDGSDINNKLNYGIAANYHNAQEDPFQYTNVYLRETYFIEKPKVESYEDMRSKYDNNRRIYYAIMDRIPVDQLDRLGGMGLEISDTIKGGVPGDESADFAFAVWRVQDFPGIIKAQGKTVSSARVSTFSLKRSDYELYRRLNSTETDEKADLNSLDGTKVLRLYTQLNDREFLYEDATSAESDKKGINFLGLGNADGFGKGYNYNLQIDTAYVNRGTGRIKPQYLISVGVKEYAGRELKDGIVCGNEVKYQTDSYKAGRYLINATDSARGFGSDGSPNPLTAGPGDSRYLIYNTWDRLVFVEAIYVKAHDRLYIVGELRKAGINYLATDDDGNEYVNTVTLKNETDGKGRRPAGKSAQTSGLYYEFGEWENFHNDVTFSFRFVQEARNADVLTGTGGSDNKTKRFYIESETYSRTPFGNPKIAPLQGGWIELNNSIPVLSRGNYLDIINHADIFNVAERNGEPTINENVDAASSVKVISGVEEVSILNANGKRVTITDLLGHSLTNAVLNSDNVTVKAPKGFVVVSVEGEKTVKAFVK